LEFKSDGIDILDDGGFEELRRLDCEGVEICRYQQDGGHLGSYIKEFDRQPGPGLRHLP
jgi:hypothetical protein